MVPLLYYIFPTVGNRSGALHFGAYPNPEVDTGISKIIRQHWERMFLHIFDNVSKS